MPDLPIYSPNGIKVYSDLHIDGPSAVKYTFDRPDNEGHLYLLEQRIMSSLRQGKHVVLNGDIFDFFYSLFPATLNFTYKQAFQAKRAKYRGFFEYIEGKLIGPNDPIQEAGIFYIQGNHDEEFFFEGSAFEGKIWGSIDFLINFQIVHVEHGYKSNKETPVQLWFLYRMPKWVANLGIRHIICRENSPNEDTEIVSIDSRERFKDYSICVVGHTHTPCIVYYSGKIYVNTGCSSSNSIDSYFNYYLRHQNGGTYNTPFPYFIDEQLNTIEGKMIQAFDGVSFIEIEQHEFAKRLYNQSPFLLETDIDVEIVQKCYIKRSVQS